MSVKHTIELNSIRSRVRFKVQTRLSREQFTEMLQKHFRNKKKTLGGYVSLEDTVIRLRVDKEKYWAPQLQIRTEVDEDDPSIVVIRGLFGPRPAVWTFFVFLYSLGIALILILGMYGMVQKSLDQTPTGLWVLPVSFLILGGTYAASKAGQRIAKDHMSVLRTFVERVLIEEKILESDQTCKAN